MEDSKYIPKSNNILDNILLARVYEGKRNNLKILLF